MRFIVGFFIFLLPSKLGALLLKLLGHEVSLKSKLGFSLIFVKKLELGPTSKIGNFNLVLCNTLKMEKGSYIGSLNIVKGPINVHLSEKSAIGNRNLIKRSNAPVTYGQAHLRIGIFSKITVSHLIDCTRSVEIGDYSILAGANTQIWTHGYYHYPEGPGRYRIDGEVKIGNNVYVGSRCTFNLGVHVSNGITIGSNTSISKSLKTPGLYVSQPLRFIDTNAEKAKQKLIKVDRFPICETVYEKPSGNNKK